MFEAPTLNYIKNFNITDIVYSTHWYSELPFLHSSSVQAGWAYANNVNLLASGYDEPIRGSGGKYKFYLCTLFIILIY